MKKLQVRQTKTQRVLYLFMAAIFLPQGIINLMNEDSLFTLILGGFQVLISLLYIPLFLGGKWSWNDAILSPVLLVGPKTISIKSWWHRNHSLAISEIEKVQFKPEQIAFIPKNEREILYFDHLGPNSAEIIGELTKFCDAHELPTEEIGYR